jgi:transposase
MEKRDARALGKEVQQATRHQVVRLRKQGKKNKDIAVFLGISEQHASTIWQKYLKGGRNAVALGARGRRHGEKRTLTEEQEREVKQLIIDKTPDQLRFPFALWTRKAVQELIQKKYGTVMPIRTVGEYLSRWGFTPQKPVKRAKEQNTEAVNRWLKIEYPKIAARAKEEKAEIYWGDETGIQNEANRVLGYSPRGISPVIQVTAKKERISMISAINNEGKVRFMMYRETMTSSRLITFMKRLIKDAERKIYLILDNLRVHHSKDVARWLESVRSAIEVFYLPSYSPELNPDEYLNNNLKNRVHSGTQAHTVKDLKHKTGSFMRTMVKRPHHVKRFFQHPAVTYAACGSYI